MTTTLLPRPLNLDPARIEREAREAFGRQMILGAFLRADVSNYYDKGLVRVHVSVSDTSKGSDLVAFINVSRTKETHPRTYTSFRFNAKSLRAWEVTKLSYVMKAVSEIAVWIEITY